MAVWIVILIFDARRCPGEGGHLGAFETMPRKITKNYGFGGPPSRHVSAFETRSFSKPKLSIQDPCHIVTSGGGGAPTRGARGSACLSIDLLGFMSIRVYVFFVAGWGWQHQVHEISLCVLQLCYHVSAR
jgi:hypothetical protein